MIELPLQYRRRVGFHTLSWFLGGLFTGGAISFLAFTARKLLGASPTMIGAMIGAPLIANLLAPLYVNRTGGLRPLALVSSFRIVGAALLLLIGLAVSPGVFIIIGLLGWLCFQASTAFYGQLLRDMYPADMRGRLQVLPLMGLTTGTILANIVGGHFLDLNPEAYRIVLPAGAAFGVLSGLILMRIPMAGVVQQDEPDRGVLDCFRVGLADRRFLLWTFVYSVTTFGFWIAYTSLPVYLNDGLRLSNVQYGLTLAALNVTMVIGYFFWGAFVDRRGTILAMLIGWLMAAAGTLMTAVGGNVYWAVAGQAVYGFGLAANEVSWFPVALQYAPADRVRSYMGFYLSASGLRAIVGAMTAPWMIDGLHLGSQLTYALGAAPMAIGCLLIFVVRRQLEPRNTPQAI